MSANLSIYSKDLAVAFLMGCCIKRAALIDIRGLSFINYPGIDIFEYASGPYFHNVQQILFFIKEFYIGMNFINYGITMLDLILTDNLSNPKSFWRKRVCGMPVVSIGCILFVNILFITVSALGVKFHFFRINLFLTR